MYQLPFKPDQTIVELGGGATPQFRPNVDMLAGPTVDIVADISKPLPIPTNSYDGLFCSYVLEHVSWRSVASCLKETLRILKPEGQAVFIIPNTYEQCKWALAQEEWTEAQSQCLFGDQNYAGDSWDANAHHTGFSPDSAFKLFSEAGYVNIIIMPHPNTVTDMIIEARKPMEEMNASKWTTQDRKEAYNRLYFDGGRGKVGGYSREGYWDYPVHWITAEKILEKKPESVLEIGAARGYILKKLEDKGIRCKGLEISEHCYQTRVVDDIDVFDVAANIWPVRDQSYDLAFSCAVLEHIPEDRVDFVMKELGRTCKRGLHGVDFGEHDDGFDKTHCTLKPKEWWQAKMPPGHEVVDKEELEKGTLNLPQGDGKVKVNVGSFTTMFHYGWINMDQHDLGEWAKKFSFNYKQHDARKPLPFENGTVDMMYHCHFLEHLDYRAGMTFLRECARVIKPDGVMRIILPDAAGLMAKYQKNELGMYDELNDGCAASSAQISKLWTLLMSGHSSMYDESTLHDTLEWAGFSQVKRMAFRSSFSKQMLTETVDMYPSLSLFVEAIR